MARVSGKPRAVKDPTKPKPKTGKGSKPGSGPPSSYNKQKADAIIAMMAGGMSCKRACDAVGQDRTIFDDWVDDNHDDLIRRYARADQRRAAVMGDEILEISDDGSNDIRYLPGKKDDDPERAIVDHEVLGRSKLRVDTRKWLMARMNPSRFGDKVVQQIVGPDDSEGEPGPVLFATIAQPSLEERRAARDAAEAPTDEADDSADEDD